MKISKKRQAIIINAFDRFFDVMSQEHVLEHYDLFEVIDNRLREQGYRFVLRHKDNDIRIQILNYTVGYLLLSLRERS